MAVMDHSATLRTIAQQIQSVTHHLCPIVPFDAVCNREERPQGHVDDEEMIPTARGISHLLNQINFGIMWKPHKLLYLKDT
ncbi:hypothetical protein TNCV_1442361 [Trichonephila clavipes]|uniref:Uncharacterized protein n=1 Tax=Trichonephila clavipes TaxID=2585209 RepID=A0A8X6RPD2_TRICX|nr:hypothetical protein TNCV_1442361 [Trichonephila clavipes]